MGLYKTWQNEQTKWQITHVSDPVVPKIEGLPAVVDDENLAQLLGFRNQYLWYVVHNTEKCYFRFWIDKDNHQIVNEFDEHRRLRAIDAPSKSLKVMQGKIAALILSKLPMHECNFAYVKGKNTRMAVERHTDDKVIARVDLKDFFPSHHVPFIRAKLEEITGYPPEVAWLLTRICTLHGSMPQGSVTSPLLSIVLNYDMDVRIARWAAEHGLSYTRYADDMVFGSKTEISTKQFWRWIAGDIVQLVHPFRINFDKVEVMRHRAYTYTSGIIVDARVPNNVSIEGFKIRRGRNQTEIFRKEPLDIDEYQALANKFIESMVGNPQTENGRTFTIKPRKFYMQSIKRMLGLNLTDGIKYPRPKFNQLRLEAFLAAKGAEGISLPKVRGKIAYVKTVAPKQGEVLDRIYNKYRGRGVPSIENRSDDAANA